MTRRGLCGLVLCIALGFSGHAAADGGELGALLTKLASDDRALMGEAISGLGRRDEPAALAVLLALRDGKLRADAAGKLYVSGDAGLVDPLTGKPAAADKASLRSVTTNNVLRRQLGPA